MLSSGSAILREFLSCNASADPGGLSRDLLEISLGPRQKLSKLLKLYQPLIARFAGAETIFRSTVLLPVCQRKMNNDRCSSQRFTFREPPTVS